MNPFAAIAIHHFSYTFPSYAVGPMDGTPEKVSDPSVWSNHSLPLVDVCIGL